VFARHTTCTGAAICDDVFIVAPLAEGLVLAAELKQVLKQDLDLDVPKVTCFFSVYRINFNQRRLGRSCPRSFPKCSAG